MGTPIYSTMKLILTALAGVAYSQSVPATSGWTLNCQTTSSPNDDGALGPAFLSNQPLSNGEYNFFWSSFGRGYGAVSASGQYGNFTGDSFCEGQNDNQTTQLVETNVFKWPNEVKPVPLNVFNSNGYFTVANGFATPTTKDGCVAIVNSNGNLPAQVGDVQFLTNGCGQGSFIQTKYFYHYVKWVDMDGDGDLDLVTARSSGSTDPTNLDESALVWLTNPGTGFDPAAKVWKVNVVRASNDIADTAFDIMTYSGVMYGIAGGFASGTLALFSGSNWSKKAPSSKTIARNNPFYFTTKFEDLNMDGIPDVLVTIGSYGAGNGQLIVYPGQASSSGSYSLGSAITIDKTFPVYNSKALGSPGEAFRFDYSTRNIQQGLVPSILVSGDDDGNIYMVDPVTTDPSSFNWNYNDKVTIFASAPFNPFVTPLTAPTIGQPSIVDIDGDGCTDIGIPAYSLKMNVFIEQKFTATGCQPLH